MDGSTVIHTGLSDVDHLMVEWFCLVGMADIGTKGKHVRACYGGHQCKTGS